MAGVVFSGQDNMRRRDKLLMLAAAAVFAAIASCGAPTEVPVCRPESDAEVCGRSEKSCGDVSAKDNCGKVRTVNCGPCAGSETCTGGAGCGTGGDQTSGFRSCSPASLVDAISRDQLYATLWALTQLPKRSGWDGQNAALEVIRRRLSAVGITAADLYYEYGGQSYVNLEFDIPARDGAAEIYAAGAHYDAVEEVDGASDNASGVAAIIELARVFKDCTFKHPVRFFLFSNEEDGTAGSKAYTEFIAKRGDNIGGFLCVDTIGWRPADGFVDIVARPAYKSFVDDVVAAAVQYSHAQVDAVIADACGCGDEGPFWEHGYDAAFVIDDYPVTNPYYHTEQDTLETLDLAYHHKAVGAIAAALAVLADR
jgi:hypothetical protein